MDADAITDTRLSVDQEARLLDVKGLNCPMPLLKAKLALNGMAAGETLRVVATDPGSVRDFQVFSQQSGHELLCSSETEGTFEYVLRKAAR